MAADRDTRQRLLDEAIIVIETEGEAAVRVRDVSAAAGVSYASLYHFFTDREGLIEAAQVERLSRHLFDFHTEFAHLVASCRSESDFHLVLRHALASMHDTGRRDTRWTRLNVWGTAQSRPSLAARIADAQTLHNASLAGILVGPQRKGWIRGDVDLQMFGSWLISTMTGRFLVEIEPDANDLAAWDRISSDAVFAVLTGTLSPPIDG